MTLKSFIKDWTLPIAMAVGAGCYFLFHYVGFMAPLKPAVWTVVDILTPALIFAQLFLTFCKVEPALLKVARWHWILLAFQFVASLMMAFVLIFLPLNEIYHEIFEGALVCLICPTATAAAVVTDKLGGSAARITVYTLMSNILAAIFVPAVFPLVEDHAGLGFMHAFMKILGKVFTLLICPFLLAMLLRYGLAQGTWFLQDAFRGCILSVGIGSGFGSRPDSPFAAQQYGSRPCFMDDCRSCPSQLCRAVLVWQTYRQGLWR